MILISPAALPEVTQICRACLSKQEVKMCGDALKLTSLSEYTFVLIHSFIYLFFLNNNPFV